MNLVWARYCVLSTTRHRRILIQILQPCPELIILKLYEFENHALLNK